MAAIEDIADRKALYDEPVAAAYERGKALNAASILELDDGIDPAGTRHWIVKGLQSAPPPSIRGKKKRPYIDTWQLKDAAKLWKGNQSWFRASPVRAPHGRHWLQRS